MEEEFLRIWEYTKESILSNSALAKPWVDDLIVKALVKKPFTLLKNISKFYSFNNHQKKAFKNMKPYSEDAINAFEEWREYIHNHYSNSHEKLFNFAIKAFNHMEECETEELVLYCSRVWISSDPQEYGEFVLKQLDKTLKTYYNNSFLSYRFDQNKISTKMMMASYKNLRSRFLSSENEAKTSYWQWKSLSQIKSNTVHEWDHYFQSWLNGNGIKVWSEKKAVIRWGPLYKKMLHDIHPYMHQIVLYSKNEETLINKKKDDTCPVWFRFPKALMSTLAPKERFNLQKVIEIASRIRQTQALTYENYWDKVLSKERFDSIITRTEKYNTFWSEIVNNIRPWEIDTFCNRINNDFF